MPRVTLVSTLHDSAGWSIAPLEESASLFDALYERRIVVATKGTSPAVIDALEASGWTLISPRSNVGVEYIADSRLRVIRAGVEAGADHVHLIDMDRVLYWAAHYPDELREIVGKIPDLDFTIIGRTPRALQTHPRNQIETEAIANKVFSLIYGRYVDITAASRGISKAATEILMNYSRGRFFDNDSEWPTILLRKGGLSLGYIEAEGLEWETRLKREQMTLPDGKLVDVKEYYERNPESWVYRLMLAHRIAKVALETSRDMRGGYRTDS
jgi:hypothetical protein